jgi:hypothetical protein
LKVEAAGDAVNVDAFACEMQARYFATLHSFKINLLEAHAAAGDKLVFVSLNLSLVRSQPDASNVQPLLV